MGYIQSFQHLCNYVNKIASINNIEYNINEIISELNYIYNSGIADIFISEFKNDLECITSEQLISDKIGNIKNIGTNKIVDNLNEYLAHNSHKHTLDFISEMTKINPNTSGVYYFKTKKTPMYIGMSKDLRSRIPSSFSDKFSRFNKRIYFNYILTENPSDAAILEIYYISILQPKYNGTSKYGMAQTIIKKLLKKYQFDNSKFIPVI